MWVCSFGLEVGQDDVYTKPWKSDYTEVKAYHISLSSFLLKTMEKLVERHIKDGVLNPINSYDMIFTSFRNWAFNSVDVNVTCHT
jgi:hypothetical protein